ncbi:hypothetical protein HK104_000345 [Borealophlyctis nickersoniae]|nr:hypothetical protein HK104_000345 [Borealophlyctis nickersoniae]
MVAQRATAELLGAEEAEDDSATIQAGQHSHERKYKLLSQMGAPDASEGIPETTRTKRVRDRPKEGLDAAQGTAPTDDPKAAKSSTRRPRKRTSRKNKRPAPKTKAVVRRLPPNVPEEIFIQSVEKWIGDTDWTQFIPGKLAKSKAKENVYSRAYFNFKSVDALLEFSKAYGGHLFVDGKGHEYRALVEFAPFQRVPKKRKKADARMNTIEQDPDYIAFLESLNPKTDVPSSESNAPAGEAPVEKSDKPANTIITNALPASEDKPKSTPLLDDLRAKKAAVAASQSGKRATTAAKKSELHGKEGGLKPTAIAKRPSTPQGKQQAKQQQSTSHSPKQKHQQKQKQSVQQASTQREAPSEAAATVGEAANTQDRAVGDKKKEGSRRMALAPTGSLFKASLANVLGTAKEPRKRGGRRQAEAESTQDVNLKLPQEEPVNATTVTAPDSAPAPEVPKEVKGRGYRKGRQARAEAAAAADENQARTPSLSEKPSLDLVDASASGQPGEMQTGEVGSGGARRNRRRNRGRSDVGAVEDGGTGGSRPQQPRMEGTGSPGPAERPSGGPRVVLMKRDGTTSAFNVGPPSAS